MHNKTINPMSNQSKPQLGQTAIYIAHPDEVATGVFKKENAAIINELYE